MQSDALCVGDDTATLVDLLQWRAHTNPSHVAYHFLGSSPEPERLLSYTDLDRQARAIAAVRQATWAPGARVLLCLPPGLEYSDRAQQQRAELRRQRQIATRQGAA